MLQLSQDGEAFDALVVAQHLEDHAGIKNVQPYIGDLIDGAVADPEIMGRHAKKETA
jgi:hypothetical protein